MNMKLKCGLSIVFILGKLLTGRTKTSLIKFRSGRQCSGHLLFVLEYIFPLSFPRESECISNKINNNLLFAKGFLILKVESTPIFCIENDQKT